MTDDPSLIDLLLPGTTDAGLDGLAYSTFLDNGVAVPVSAVDQLLVAFSRHLIDQMPRTVAVLQLPRAHHRIALTLAICLHLLRLQQPLVAGPVVLAALDVDLTEQLRHLRWRNYRNMALDRQNPLSAQRLTRRGHLVPVLGTAPRPADSSLIYVNTRIGNPALPHCNPPLVIIDAASITPADSRAKMLAWASHHSAVSTVVVGDIGDESLVKAVTATGATPLVLPLTDAEVNALVYELNRQKPEPSPLSSMWMLWRDKQPRLNIYRAGDTEINDAITRAFACLATRPDGLAPQALDYPTKLLYSGTRLTAAVCDYRRACALAVRPGEGPATLLRVLHGLTFTGPGPWHAWGVARWGELKVAVDSLWRHLEESTPKLDLLWELLARAEHATCGRILIRCHSNAAAVATAQSLGSENRTSAQIALWMRISARVEIDTFAKRHPPRHAGIQILTGNPPARHFSLLFSGEADENWLLAYDVEDAILRHQLRHWHDTTDAWRQSTFRALGASEPATVAGPLVTTELHSTAPEPPELHLPQLSILDVLDSADRSIDLSSILGTASNDWFGPETTSCVPILLDNGRTWWVRTENDHDGDLATPILVVTGNHRYLPLRDIRPGDAVVVPAGDGTDSVHARLITLSHTNDDVAALDAILGQFRRAARQVLETHSTLQAAIAAVRNAGAQAPGELKMWASGRTIAPRVPQDIAAVFLTAQQSSPDLWLLHSVAGRLRTLHRSLGHFVKALASGHAGAAVNKLRSLVGDGADELLEEFLVATVISVGAPTDVPAGFSGRIQ
ncbi:DISARM anti-phage system protein DrmE domain-containing protein [Nocardia tengchongensis]|uniref:DISARM anti-phage system protein DrmE domain-containing protein n=1 Tax=Nocardia tengchongensis TaxID=2055889 RepID=UPI003687F7A1